MSVYQRQKIHIFGKNFEWSSVEEGPMEANNAASLNYTFSGFLRTVLCMRNVSKIIAFTEKKILHGRFPTHRKKLLPRTRISVTQ